ncbi:MAG TPA: aminodeoxychorismate/anthranilate synthase component II [Gemmatimonadaceae bacterium]|nr:aminodeoxychorismate/anthranilate synthase component II [Gemmatimonadaceae bacterium]
MILLIDNYDSFVYNLARYVRELGLEPVVRRHDAVTVEEIEGMRPTHIIISPGPCSPAEAGISTEVVRHFGARGVPVLGVCLGHQCIGEAYGGEVVRAARPMHGKVSRVYHDGTSVFAGLPSPLHATRYHSLVVRPESLPPSLRVIAHTRDASGRPDEVMGVVHREHPVVGVQFHPESALTEYGYAMLDRFLRGDASRPAALPDRADMAASVPDDSARAAEPEFVPPSVDLVR